MVQILFKKKKLFLEIDGYYLYETFHNAICGYKIYVFFWFPEWSVYWAIRREDLVSSEGGGCFQETKGPWSQVSGGFKVRLANLCFKKKKKKE